MVKTTTILGITFEVYPLEETNFNEAAGVYVIATSEKWLDVGETDKLGSRLENHERKPCWYRNSDNKTILVCFKMINNQQERFNLEKKLREELKPACGEE